MPLYVIKFKASHSNSIKQQYIYSIFSDGSKISGSDHVASAGLCPDVNIYLKQSKKPKYLGIVEIYLFIVELFRKRVFSYTAKTIKDQEIYKGEVETYYEHKK